MFITELFDPMPYGYGTEKEDNSGASFRASRKTRLTLAQLNKLRTMNDVRKFEQEGKLEKVKTQYAAPAADAGGMPMM